jgi:hypothetical protein
MKPYHNEGFFKVTLVVIFMLVPLPYIIGYLAWGRSLGSYIQRDVSP